MQVALLIPTSVTPTYSAKLVLIWSSVVVVIACCCCILLYLALVLHGPDLQILQLALVMSPSINCMVQILHLLTWWSAPTATCTGDGFPSMATGATCTVWWWYIYVYILYDSIEWKVWNGQEIMYV